MADGSSHRVTRVKAGGADDLLDGVPERAAVPA